MLWEQGTRGTQSCDHRAMEKECSHGTLSIDVQGMSVLWVTVYVGRSLHPGVWAGIWAEAVSGSRTKLRAKT